MTQTGDAPITLTEEEMVQIAQLDSGKRGGPGPIALISKWDAPRKCSLLILS